MVKQMIKMLFHVAIAVPVYLWLSNISAAGALIGISIVFALLVEGSN
jgi:hypothetical protein